MELRHLRYFSALVETQTFTAAAEKVHISQSTLSHQIRQLEDELGKPLFLRVGKRALLTEAGQLFQGFADRALREVAQGRALLRNPTQEQLGHLRIAVGATFSVKFIPDCLNIFMERFSHVRTSVKELSADEITAQVRSGDIDLGVSWQPEDLSDLVFEPLHVEEMVLVVSPNHPIAKKRRITMAELSQLPLVLTSAHFFTRRMLDECFKQCGVEPNVVAEIDSIAAAHALLLKRQLATILSRHAIPEHTDLKIVPIENPTPTRTPGILWRPADKPPFVLAFAAIVREVAFDRKMSLKSTPSSRFEQ